MNEETEKYLFEKLGEIQAIADLNRKSLDRIEELLLRKKG